MSCIVKDKDSKKYAFVKGSPEMISSICLKNTFDSNKFHSKLTTFGN